MEKKDCLYIVMPAYNEQENIRNVIEQWYPLLEGKSSESRLVIADAGSTDDTHAIIEEMQKTHTQLVCLKDTNRYHGPKVIALYDYAIRANADYVFQTDSDGQTLPEEFPAFWEERNNYDGVIANRPVREDGAARSFVENVVCLLLRFFFGIKVEDANAPFRLMKTELVKKYLYRLPTEYNLPNIMLTTYFVYYKENIAFRDITFRPRQGGENFINIPSIVKIGWGALSDFSKFKAEMKRHE